MIDPSQPPSDEMQQILWNSFFRISRERDDLKSENAQMRALLEQITDTWWSTRSDQATREHLERLMQEAHDWLVQHPKEQP